MPSDADKQADDHSTGIQGDDGGHLANAAGPVVPLAGSPVEHDPSTTEISDEHSTATPRAGRAHKASAAEPPVPKPAMQPPAQAAMPTDHLADQESPVPAIGIGQTGPAVSSGGSLAGDPSAAAQPPAGGDASSSTPQLPASQLGQALAAIHTTSNGSSQIRILLNPAELGSVQVHITRTHDGAASVSVSVERPETLRSLQTDLSHLHQALDRAGMPEQRSVVLHLATSDGAAGGLQTSGQAGSGGQGTAQGDPRQNADRGQSNVQGNGQDMRSAGDAGVTGADTRSGLMKWHRAGVNITA